MYIPVVVAGQHDQELQRPLHQHAQPAAPSRRGEQQERRRQLRDERYLAMLFLGRFSPKFRTFYAIFRPFAPSWRQKAGNRERTVKKRRKKRAKSGREIVG